VTDSFYVNDRDSLIGDKMDKKLINLCRAHDEICEIAKQVNRMFSFQMLITMAYGFMSITAQFYFLYCGLMDQVLAKQQRLACEAWVISLIN
jgi:gustatory receptor